MAGDNRGRITDRVKAGRDCGAATGVVGGVIIDTIVEPGRLQGRALIPASKSHTIRALLVAALAAGESTIINPLTSDDSVSCRRVVEAFGARVQDIDHRSPDGGTTPAWRVTGTGGRFATPDDVIDVGNSGTTLFLALGIAAAAGDPAATTVFTGDAQIRRRSAGNLLAALNDLGAQATSSRGDGCAPIVIRGPLKGGATSMECPTSQYLSSLLLAAPLAAAATTVDVPLLYEQPYAAMTLAWLDSQGIVYERRGWQQFVVPGGQRYRPFDRLVPGDFSSATFLMCAAAVGGSRVTCLGLDMQDSQGDKAVVAILEQMGCAVDISGDSITIDATQPARLRGGTFDLNAIPDALPALAVTGCFADSPVTLTNVPQARLKETDRIAVMTHELRRFGARVDEHRDGMTVYPSRLRATALDGHHDHRVVMALAIGALGAEPTADCPGTRISDSEAAAITFPGFFALLESLHA